MKCPSCGFENEEGAEACRDCGQALQTQPAEAPTHEMIQEAEASKPSGTSLKARGIGIALSIAPLAAIGAIAVLFAYNFDAMLGAFRYLDGFMPALGTLSYVLVVAVLLMIACLALVPGMRILFDGRLGAHSTTPAIARCIIGAVLAFVVFICCMFIGLLPLSLPAEYASIAESTASLMRIPALACTILLVLGALVAILVRPGKRG